MKKVSVIVTTYNSESSINETIKSILEQDGIGVRFQIELIVIDDCSTDQTINIVSKTGATILSTTGNSGGPNAGRNIGLKHATGDFICIVDHDDMWNPVRISKLLPLLEDVPIVSSGFTRIDKSTHRNTDFIKSKSPRLIKYLVNQTFKSVLTKSSKGQCVYLGSIMYSKKLAHIRFEEHFGCVDYDWLLRIFHNHASQELNEPLYVRYVDDENLSLDESYRRKDFYYSLMSLESYQMEFPSETARASRNIHGTRARYYYQIGDMQKARTFLLRARLNLKTIAYYITTFVGSGWVKNRFNVFK